MGKAFRLSKADVAEIQKRGLAGESSQKIADDYGLSGSTVAYHIAKVRPPKKTKAPVIHKKKNTAPKYIDMPLNTPKKVAVIITDSNSIAQVLGDLWK